MDLRGKWLLASESQQSTGLMETGLAATAGSLIKRDGTPPTKQEPGRDPRHGGQWHQREGVLGHGNFNQKQQPGWMGLG